MKTLAVLSVSGDAAARFEPDGRYAVAPREWPGTREALRQPDFFAAFEQALANLPPAAARAFVLREVERRSLADTAAALGVDEATCLTLLHTARTGLRDTLEARWFAAPGPV